MFYLGTDRGQWCHQLLPSHTDRNKLGTEQVSWKDLATDVNLIPTSLNPERIDDDQNSPLVARLVKAALQTDKDKMMVWRGIIRRRIVCMRPARNGGLQML